MWLLQREHALRLFRCLLALVMILLVPGSTHAQVGSPPVYAEVQDFQELPDRFVFQVSLSNERRVRILYVRLVSDNTRVGSEKEYENPGRIIKDQFLKTDLRPGKEYTIQIRATDRAGNLIPLPSDNPEDRPVTILEEYTFTYEEEVPSPIDFDIRMMSVRPELGTLRIDLGGIDPREADRIRTVEGIILDGNKQPVDRFVLEQLPSLTIDRPIPQDMIFTGTEQKFTLTIYIVSREGLESEGEPYEITVQPVPAPTLGDRLLQAWERLLRGIQQETILFIGIVVVALNTVGWLMFRGGKRKKKTVFQPPPVDPTGIGIPSIKAKPSRSIQVEIVRTPDKKATGKTLKQPAFSIGRYDTDIIIDDERMSRCHLMVQVEGETVQIKDCRSKNGTSVDGKSIEPERWVDIGNMNVIQLGPNTDVKIKIKPDNGVRR